MAIDIAIVDDKNWDHKDDNCKLCGTAQREEPLDTPYPGQVKRKEISTHNSNVLLRIFIWCLSS